MTDDLRPARMDDIPFYLHLRSRVEHEDGLIVSRLSWLMASESFFFTAYAIALNGPPTRDHLRLLTLIPLVAVISSAFFLAGIVAAVGAIEGLRGLMRERVADPSSLGLPPLTTPGRVKAGLAAPLVLPLVFIVVWLYLRYG
jgi:hypothetical protein